MGSPSPADLRSRAGGGLVEILIALLIISLLAAAAMTKLMERQEQMEDASGQLKDEDLARILQTWTSDPAALDRGERAGDTPSESQHGLDGTHPPPDRASLDSAAERQAYETLVHQLEEQDLLDDWKQLLRERLDADHPLLVAIDGDGSSGAGDGGAVEIRWASEDGDDATTVEAPGSGSTPGGVRWADGEPVRVLEAESGSDGGGSDGGG